MTSETREPGTTVTRRPNLSPEMEARVEQRRLQSAMVQKIRGATWGQQWDANTISAVAAWAREADVDPITEIDVLGGNIYIRARHYERKMGELIAAGQIEYARKDWVHVDKRLEKLADAGDEQAKAESKRRMKARIAANLSDEATAACVYRIKHRMMGEEVTGAKEFVPGKRKDPVGEAMPMETIETRALRRAMLQLKESLPGLRVAATNDDAFVDVGDVVKENHARLKADRQLNAAPVETVEIRSDKEPTVQELIPDEDDESLDQEIEAADRRAEQTGLGLPDAPPRRRSAQQQGR